jgi:hypothetical protein
MPTAKEEEDTGGRRGHTVPLSRHKMGSLFNILCNSEVNRYTIL